MTWGQDGRDPNSSALPEVGPNTAAALFGLVILVTHGLGNSLAPALLPRIAESFQTGYGILGAAVAASVLAYGLGAMVGVRVVSRMPSRSLLIVCLMISGLGLLCVAVVRSAPMLAVCIIMTGLVSPISWSASVHIIGQVVRSDFRGRVMAVGAAGGGIGIGINGVFVQTLTGSGDWRWAFVIAAGLAVLTVVATFSVLRHPITPPARPEHVAGRDVWREVWAARAGRMVVLLGVGAGMGGFTFSAYLSEIALDELMVAPLTAAALWWLASVVGAIAAWPAGRAGDLGSPVAVLSMTALAYAASLTIMAVTWVYPALIVAVIGFAVFALPIWGLLGLAVQRSLPPQLVVHTISAGLIVAALSAAVSISAAGIWIERNGSFRGPMMFLALLMASITLWLWREQRADPSAGRRSGSGPDRSLS